MGPRSDFLYAQPSFLEGVARILDIGNTLNQYNTSPTEDMADEAALRMDWIMVGNDIRNATTKVMAEEIHSHS